MVNCPYKVRRFNFKDYHSDEAKSLENIHNPDVTLRMRGIVEKCTFCIQRIIKAKYNAQDEGRNRLEDSELKTACQVACPTSAISFGDLNNSHSEVALLAGLPHSYKLLSKLGTKPSVNYLAKITFQE
jgi:molybdopterin-containing oxidoreductase family iron-sulfur binding subunit